MNMNGKKKKKHYWLILSCLLVSAVGFGTVYGIEEHRQKQEKLEAKQSQQNVTSQVSGIIEPKTSQAPVNSQVPSSQIVKDIPTQLPIKEEPKEPIEDKIKEPASEKEKEKEVAETISDYGISLPINTALILDYSMDKTIYFPTLDVYKYNPAMIYSAKVNDKVSIVAKGVITKIYDNEETGCTVVEDLGGGFEAIYGQLKDVTFKEGESVEAGHVIGFVKEPTKYYVKEGANVFFQLRKDGEPVDPKNYFH